MGSIKWVSVKEMKKVSCLVAPMVGFMILQSVAPVVSVMMVGHLDELSLSGASVATSFTNVTGFAFLFGMACALDTLCGQAYGAEEYEKLGNYTYGAIICLILASLPICVVWIFTDKLLILIGQDPSISTVARNFSICLIPRLLAYAFLQPFSRFLQTQSLILPLLFTTLATLFFQIPLTWIFLFKLDLKTNGAAFALSISSWFNVFLLGFYVKFSSKCQTTRAGSSPRHLLRGIIQFLRLALPSTAMVCLEWWSSEVLILLSGLLPNPKLETSVVSICFTIIYIHFYVTYGFGGAVSVRVSNELGAGNAKAAKMATASILVLGMLEVICISAALFSCRKILGYAFSNQKEIVDRIADLSPLMCFLIIIDSFQAVFSGVIRGSGWQDIGAYINLGAYYLIGIPAGAVLTFVLHLKSKGLMIGFFAGAVVHAALLALIILFTDWQKQASKVRDKMLQSH